MPIIEFNGVKNTIRYFAKEYGINEVTLSRRIKNGMTVEDALKTPVSRLKTIAGKIGCSKRWNKEIEIEDIAEKARDKHPLYKVWQAMRSRCKNPKHKYYDSYGGRGITVCSRWEDFLKFIEDMGERPDGFSLERIDNNKGYSPDNCKWASQAEQNRNRRRNVFLEFDGRRLCIKDWANELGISTATIRDRIKKGMSIEDVLKKKVRAE